MDNFDGWLQSVTDRFSQLSANERLATFDALLGKCGGTDLFNLGGRLFELTKRDFLILLPPELRVYLLAYLDPITLLACCQVSCRWNDIVSHCKPVWYKACISLKCEVDRYEPATFYNRRFVKLLRFRERLFSSGTLERRVLAGHRGCVNAIHYWNDYVVSSSEDRTLRLWNCNTSVCELTIEDINSASCLRLDEDYIIVGAFAGTCCCWSRQNGHLLHEYVGHVAAIFSVDFLKHHNLLATGSADGSVKLWNFDTSVILKTIHPPPESAWVHQVFLFPATPELTAEQKLDPGLKYSVVCGKGQCYTSWHLDDDFDVLQICVLNEMINDDVLLPGMYLDKAGRLYAAIRRDNTVIWNETNPDKLKFDGRAFVWGSIPEASFAMPLAIGKSFALLVTISEGVWSAQFPWPSVTQDGTNGTDLVKFNLSRHGIIPHWSSTISVGDTDWLDGFVSDYVGGVLLAAVHDCDVVLYCWK